MCWLLFYFESSLSQDQLVFCSYPIFCFHSLLTQLLMFPHSMLFSWKIKMGWCSGFCLSDFLLCAQTCDPKTAEYALPSPPISLVLLHFFHYACFSSWMWSFRQRFRTCLYFTEGPDGLEWVAFASGLGTR